MNLFKAEHFLFTYPNSHRTRLSDVYDEDAALREVLGMLFPGFEYPDFAHRDLMDLWMQYVKDRPPVDRSAAVLVRFPDGVASRKTILGELDEQLYSIMDLANGDLVVEYASHFELEAAQKRLNGQVPLAVLTREEFEAFLDSLSARQA